MYREIYITMCIPGYCSHLIRHLWKFNLKLLIRPGGFFTPNLTTLLTYHRFLPEFELYKNEISIDYVFFCI